MKSLPFGFLLTFVINSIAAQNVGIGTTTPSRKFTVRQDGIGITQENANGAVQVGFFANASYGFLQTYTNYPLAFTTNNGSPQMLLSTDGNLGIGTTVPQATAQLHLELGTSLSKGLLVTGTYNPGATIPDLGDGTRLMFYPGRAAFRAGYGGSLQWNNANVGSFSAAFGDYNTASGTASTAMGLVQPPAATFLLQWDIIQPPVAIILLQWEGK